MLNIEEAIAKLIRGQSNELESYLEEIYLDEPIKDTSSSSFCHFFKLNGNGQTRMNDFAEFLSYKILDYSIPRTEIDKAKENDASTNSSFYTLKLAKKAKNLFTTLKKSGESGELLLYVLVQEFLKTPQLICKMPLKTSHNLHYNGSDGIHFNYDKKTDKLALYWGEAKLYSSLDYGIKKCLESIKPFLVDNKGSKSVQNRDLELIRSNMKLNDKELENALLDYLDKDNPKYNKLEYRGVCLVGFDYNNYPSKDKTDIDIDKLKESILNNSSKWKDLLSENILSEENKELKSFILNIFLIPFPSVQDFRDAFLNELGLNTNEN